jgi:hypothetical protein
MNAMPDAIAEKLNPAVHMLLLLKRVSLLSINSLDLLTWADQT